ncbi:hypothetical protein P153DRAFT_434341 [Dothidotthia symphoricarpi CBS 119687]|uniref:Uncharacterized protein n=1 Tax=Dothidotthia symphoricarpi CBS 119687 TaxID=1392245 RepID=A0A6A6A5A2_9PLEO|nr:uncharacterized protein P153DRAFT_434341 [Dothidotthia symphoricarpi CBS 119687]KAF2125948.1 hypothetical protein P153DRAFT_434341 [Dothidotthia symphoricarpi CBS 119687]
MSSCFLKALANVKKGTITQQEYISCLVSHFRGVRHSDDSVPSIRKPLTSFEPWAASLRELALATNYKPLEDTSEYEQLFITCLEGQLDEFKSALQTLRSRSSQPDLLQPAACLAAQKQHLEILRYCLEEGALFDVYLTRASQMGARGNTTILEFLLAKNWADIQRSPEAMEEQIKHFGDDSMEAEWLRTHAGKGAIVENPLSPSKAKAKVNKNGKSQGKGSSKGNGDPNQGHTPEQIQRWFGDVPW